MANKERRNQEGVRKITEIQHVGLLKSIKNILAMSSPDGRHKLVSGTVDAHSGDKELVANAGMVVVVVNNADELFTIIRSSKVVRAEIQQKLKAIGPLLAEEGRLHRVSRQAVEHLLQKRAIAHYLPTIAEISAASFSRWLDLGEFDPVEVSNPLLEEIVAETIFSGADVPHDLIKMIPVMLPKLVDFGQHDITPGVGMLPKKGRKEFNREKAYFYSVFGEYVETQLEANNPSVVNHMVHKLKDEFEDQGFQVNQKGSEDRQKLITTIIEAVNGFWIAATETTSHVFSFALEYLSKYPEKMDRVRQEVASVLGDKAPEAITMEDLDNLPYTRACFLEALRLMPPVEINLRQVEADENGEGITVNEAYYPAGAMLLLNVRQVLRDKGIWGEDAEEYVPERLEGAYEEHFLWKTLMAAFADPSKHKCAGEKLAIAEGTLMLALAARQFQSLEGQQGMPEAIYGPTITPKPFRVRVS